MVLAGSEHLTQNALTFWASHLPGGVPDDLQAWLKDRVEETQVHCQNVGWLEELQRLMKPLTPWRDTAVAHLEVDARLPDVAWSDLDHAIDGVIDVFRRYSLRFTGVNYQFDHEGPPWQDRQKEFMQPLFVDRHE